jgi:hypothetical protein
MAPDDGNGRTQPHLNEQRRADIGGDGQWQQRTPASPQEKPEPQAFRDSYSTSDSAASTQLVSFCR